MTGRFIDSTVFITGASRGLGRGIALAFAREGAFVVVGVRSRKSDAEETLRQVEALGAQGVVETFDVREAPSVDAAVQRVLERRGRIDVVVNNAGVARDELFAVMQPESWSEVLRTNLDGTFNVCRAVTRPMMANKRGAIVNVGSIAGQRASKGQVNYAASKGGVLALTTSLAAELAPKGIRVNAVVPGLCSVGMVEAVDRRVIDAKKAHIPLGRLGTADDVARVVLFLASDDSAYVVGQALVVDGGLGL
jgi:3-oxoacyl-[acyl-carrier protein] reductase